MSNSVFGLLAASLNLSQRAESLTTNNLANLQTPGYQAQRLAFRRALAQAWQTGAPLGAVTGTVTTVSGAVSASGNGVSMTAEMTQLMQDQLLYSTAAQAWTDEMTQLNTAAGGQVP